MLIADAETRPDPDTLAQTGVGFYQKEARKSACSGSVLLRIAATATANASATFPNIGAVTPEKPKYRFPEGLRKNLEVFGAWQLRERAPVRILYLAESPLTVMASARWGCRACRPTHAPRGLS